MPTRLFYVADLDGDSADPDAQPVERHLAPEPEANLISSLCDDGRHMPVLDIDRMPVKVVESSTPGNFHLYIDRPMTWAAYARLLAALGAAGILEAGYVSASLERGATYVRKPGVRKAVASD